MKIILDIDDAYIPPHAKAILEKGNLTDEQNRQTVEAFLYVAMHHFDSWNVVVGKCPENHQHIPPEELRRMYLDQR